MFRWLNLLLLLFCFINVRGTKKMKKGGNVTLSCESVASEITDIELNRLSKNILVCENEECESENDRVFKEGSCDVIIKDLRFSDAGKYTLRVRYNNTQTELEPLILEYHLYVHGEISVNKGEDLKLDVLLINADKVERNSSSGWTELWTRGHGVNSDRLTVSNETLIINRFTDTDTGTYRVLDSNNQTWITVTVTELNTDDDHKPSEPRKLFWIIMVSVCGALLVLLPGILFALIIKDQCPNRNAGPDPYQGSLYIIENGSPKDLVMSLSTCNLPSEKRIL